MPATNDDHDALDPADPLLHLKRALDVDPPDRSRCLTDAEMERAAVNQGSRAERQRWADHFVDCGDCAAQYRLLRALEPWAREAAATVSDASESLSEVEATGDRSATAAGSGTRWALAAALLASFGLGIWGLAAQRRAAGAEDRLALLAKPQVNVPIVDLEPQAAVRGIDSPAPLALPISNDTGVVTLILGTSAERTCSDYELELLSSAGASLWRGGGLEQTDYGNFSVAVPRRLLPPGDYRMILRGRCAANSAATEPLESYAWRVPPG